MSHTSKSMLMLLLIVVLMLSTACGSPATATTPLAATATSTTTRAQVATTAPDATPTVAATATPDVPAERTAQLDALYYQQTSEGAKGGTSSIQVRIRPATKPGELRVGFFQEEVEGTGQQWQSSGWIAVLLGSMLEGVNPTDYEFSFSSGGWIDGPSAGCLMTVGVLAALRNEKVREDATMTGTINPDGTIGPVGGIPHKLDGASKAGKKLVLVPIGQRYDYDTNQEKLVDLVEAGQKLGVEVREVGTIFDAYEALTGHALPRPTAGSTPQLPPRAFDRMRAKTLEWISRYQKSRNEFNSLTQQVQELIGDYALLADAKAADADKALKQGLVAVAYGRASEAAIYSQLATMMGQIVQDYLIGGLQKAVDHYQASSAAQTELKAVIATLKAEDPKTVSDVLALFDAYGNVGTAEGLLMMADGAINNLVQNASSLSKEEILQGFATAALEQAVASVAVQYARDAADIGLGFGQASVPASDKMLQIAETLRRASDSNIALFDAIIVDEYAKQNGLHPDVIKNMMMSKETNYLMAIASRRGIDVLKDEVGQGQPQAELIFGQSQNAYALSAGLLAKHYSLGAEVDKDLNVVSFRREKALGEMLDFADQRARELINAAGEDSSIAALYYYELGRSQRQGDPQEQLDALGYYWQSAMLAQAGAYLSKQ
ncbi:MAG TPA: S16 family serine protease [Anaerolineae bacterium]|nr:S16 family serine protease [Anaerolineae bacterium]